MVNIYVATDMIYRLILFCHDNKIIYAFGVIISACKNVLLQVIVHPAIFINTY